MLSIKNANNREKNTGIDSGCLVYGCNNRIGHFSSHFQFCKKQHKCVLDKPKVYSFLFKYSALNGILYCNDLGDLKWPLLTSYKSVLAFSLNFF